MKQYIAFSPPQKRPNVPGSATFSKEYAKVTPATIATTFVLRTGFFLKTIDRYCTRACSVYK